MYHRLHFPRHGFSEYHFYKRENHTRAVKCRQRQQVHHREVCRDYRHDVQEGAESRRTDFRDGGYHGDSAAGGFQTYLSRDERAERGKDLEHYEEAEAERSSQRAEEAELYALRSVHDADARLFRRFALIQILVAEGVFPDGHRDGHDFSVAQYFESRARLHVLERTDQVVRRHDVDLQSVFCEDDVARLKYVRFAVHFVCGGDHGKYLPVSGEVHRYDEYRAEEVEKRARKQHYEPFPRLLSVERAFVLHTLLVLSVEGAESAQRKGAQREQFAVFPVDFFDDRRTEAYSEFVYLESEQFPCQIVPRLVYDDHYHQSHQREQNISDIGENFTCRCRRQRKDHFILLLRNKCICELPRLCR